MELPPVRASLNNSEELIVDQQVKLLGEAVISDEALMAFVAWCRMNAWQYTSDLELVRRVFDAYAGMKPWSNSALKP